MDNEIISIEDAALYLARQHRDRLTDEGLNKRFHELVHIPWSDEDTEKYFSVGPVQRPSPAYDKQTQQEKTETRREALFGLSVRVFRAELLACMEKGFLVPINPATDHHAPEFGALGLAARVRFGDIEPAFYSSGGKTSKGGNQQPASEQSVTAAAVEQQPELDIPRARRWGVTKREILCVDWPMPVCAPPLENILDEIPKWVDAACRRIGQRGKGADCSHLWNPALLAVCLNTKTPHKKWCVGNGTLNNFLRLQFPDFFAEWENATDKGL